MFEIRILTLISYYKSYVFIFLQLLLLFGMKKDVKI